jgi:hypothetical protein
MRVINGTFRPHTHPPDTRLFGRVLGGYPSTWHPRYDNLGWHPSTHHPPEPFSLGCKALLHTPCTSLTTHFIPASNLIKSTTKERWYPPLALVYAFNTERHHHTILLFEVGFYKLCVKNLLKAQVPLPQWYGFLRHQWIEPHKYDVVVESKWHQRNRKRDWIVIEILGQRIL